MPDRNMGGALFLFAIDRLNQSIDQCDWRARNFRAQVVRAVHDHQRSAHTTRGRPVPASVADHESVGGARDGDHRLTGRNGMVV